MFCTISDCNLLRFRQYRTINMPPKAARIPKARQGINIDVAVASLTGTLTDLSLQMSTLQNSIVNKDLNTR